ncbi:MAG: hypothetical protein L0287_27095 [Anaerolineae bacterium]|nr:hypothetical protein [Anaerolineae bacterium]MCI0607523.1 hypothetical protein [Anaerolineae bacterium]
MNPKLIVIDGKTYKSVDEMPEDVRRNYESAMSQLGDEDRNGIPDVLENLTNLADQNKNGMPDSVEGMISNVISSTKIIVNGTEYNSLDELPPDIRAKYEQAMGSLDANRNGVPDFLEGMMNTSNQTSNTEHSHVMPTPRSPAPISASPTIAPETTNGWMLALLGIVLLGVCAFGAIGVWYFFLR